MGFGLSGVLRIFLDQFFGMNMQKSGLGDTMWDLMVDCLGALTGSLAGFFYLEKREGNGLLSS